LLAALSALTTLRALTALRRGTALAVLLTTLAAFRRGWAVFAALLATLLSTLAARPPRRPAGRTALAIPATRRGRTLSLSLLTTRVLPLALLRRRGRRTTAAAVLILRQRRHRTQRNRHTRNSQLQLPHDLSYP
jgi:predicted small integral membrane protein